jgi:hypothetical protein
MLHRLPPSQYMYLCNSKARKVAATAGSSCSESALLHRLLRQYLYFCTSKASQYLYLYFCTHKS